MLKNYLKIAWRNLLKNKAFSFINIFGLAMGISASMLIGLWIFDEYSFNNFHQNRKQIYRVIINGINGNNGEKFSMIASVLPLAEKFKNEFPEIQNVVETNWMGKWGLKAGETKINKSGTDVSPNFFKTFKFKFLQGDPTTALQNPESIVLTAQTAKDLFGTKDPMNKMVLWDGKETLKVTGVIEDIPKNNYFKEYQYFMPFSHFEKRQPWVKAARSQWDNNAFQMYVELQPNINVAQFEGKIKDLIKQNQKGSTNEVMLHPMEKWRLYNEFKDWQATGGSIDYVKMFGAIGILVLLIACTNFMNLSTARSGKRAREVGVRKAVGSSRTDLILQFLGESVLISTLGFLLAIFIILMALPGFNKLIQSDINYPFTNPFFWLIAIVIILITGLLAGFYPAFYLSSFDTIKVLKGKFSVGKSGTLPRKVLVVLQFSSSVALIICTWVVYQQINYVRNLPAGYNPTGVMLVNMQGDIKKNYDFAKVELLNTGMIESITAASTPIHSIWMNWKVTEFPKMQANENISMAAISISQEYFKTLQIKVKQGRDFYQNASNADSNTVIINDAAVKRMRLENPIGQQIKFGGGRLTIVGVVENTIMANPYEPVGPAAYFYNPSWASTMMFRIKEYAPVTEVIAAIAPIFNKHNPSLPFSYEFADEAYAQKFDLEVKVGKMASIFAILTILISCLGLFGLSAYTAEQRTKEIGIRKVMGASILQVWSLLSSEFVLLVMLSCLIATPIAIYYLQDWLLKYSNHVNLTWQVFAVSALVAVVIALFTVSFQAVKAAKMNPVKSLKTE
jgi:predicted permease